MFGLVNDLGAMHSGVAQGMAHDLFKSLINRSQLKKLYSRVMGKDRDLRRLADVKANSRIINRHDKGLQFVALEQIQGTEDKVADFDRDFNPTQAHSEGRWVGIAVAMMRENNLPPIELIQVGEIYYVIDGHHRVSVAKALNYSHIEAYVMVWQVQEIAISANAPCDNQETLCFQS